MFQYKNNELFIENVKASTVADKWGTPCYVYSKAILERNWQQFDNAIGNTPHQICYAVKANSNLSILNFFAKQNAGFDIVSQGELERVLIAKGDPKKIVFSGVGKQASEIERALTIGIGCFNIESFSELNHIAKIAKRLNKIAPIAIRVNPDIDARTHPYIATGLSSNKFGINYEDIQALITQIQAMESVKLIGIGSHIGSQLTSLEPFSEAIDRLLKLYDDLKNQGIAIQHINVGGGLGVRYENENPPSIIDYVKSILTKFNDCPLAIHFEPGRVLVANAGMLLTRVVYVKQQKNKNFAIVDTGMNDLLRPALYHAWHKISSIQQSSSNKALSYDIVGPVCESADFLGKDRLLTIHEDDVLAIWDTGAYGFTMSSNYNSRPRVAEVMVDGNDMILIRERESLESLFAAEKFQRFCKSSR